MKILFSYKYTSFPEAHVTCDIEKSLNVEAEKRMQLSSIKPDIKEVCKDIK